jgi:uncharacterized protein
VTVIVLAKAPAPGRVKTRLCPPCDPDQAARLAEAALVDTLRAVAATRCRRRVLVLDGAPGAWLPTGFEIVPQRGDGLDERLANAFTDVGDVGAGGLLIGMDTPQLTPARLTASLRALADRRADAVLGPAVDGGWWGIGLRAPDPAVFLGVPMSNPYTGAAQRARMRRLGLRTRALPALRDVDDFDDAMLVALAAPRGRFAATLRTMLPQLRARDAALAAR